MSSNPNNARRKNSAHKRRSPRTLGTASRRPDAVPDRSGSIKCAGGCGADIELTTDGVVMEPIRRLICQQLDGEFPTFCGDCDEKRVAEEDEQRHRDLFVTRVERSSLPKRWHRTTLDTIDDHEEGDDQASRIRSAALAASRQWAAGELMGVVLTGPVGIGKTMIAAAACRDRLERGNCRWLSVADLTARLRMPFASGEYQQAAKILGSRSATPVVLDDLDKSKPTEMSVQHLYVLINGAYDRGQPLFLTANRGLDDLAEFLGGAEGEAIVSRLAEHCEVYAMQGRDRRVDPNPAVGL